MAKQTRKRRESFGAVRTLPSGRIQASYTGLDGNRYPAPHTFDNLTVRLASPSSPFFPPGVIEPIPLHWEDTVAVRLGYEYHFDDQEVVRLGYVHHSNPIPNTAERGSRSASMPAGKLASAYTRL